MRQARLCIYIRRGLRIRRVARYLFVALLLVSLSCLLLSSSVNAATIHTQQENVSVDVQVGLGATGRVGYWLPVAVTLDNNGSSFSGKLSLRTFSALPAIGPSRTVVISDSQDHFDRPLTLAHGKQLHLSLALPFDVGQVNPRGVEAQVYDAHGQLVASQRQNVYVLNPGDVFVGILSDEQSGFNILNTLSLPNAANSLLTVPLDASNFPTQSVLLDNLDVLVLDNFATSTLHPAQLAALRTWLNRGGVLLEMGGSDWQRTLKPLPTDLLPVAFDKVSGIQTVSTYVPLLPFDTNPCRDRFITSATQVGGPTDVINRSLQTCSTHVQGTLSMPLAINAARINDASYDIQSGATVLAQNGTPIVVEAHRGQGTICYLAFDAASGPFPQWSGLSAWWRNLLLRTLGDSLLVSSTAPHYSSAPGELNARGGILPMLQPVQGFAPWLLFALLLGYILLLGPIRYLILRYMKRSHVLPERRTAWSWRILLSAIVVFSLLSYALAYYQKGNSVVANSISVIQVDQGSASAHVTTYLGMFVPSPGQYEVHLSGDAIAQPVQLAGQTAVPSIFYQGLPTTVSYGSSGLNVDIQSDGLWTYHSFVSEQDRALPGTLSGNLHFLNGHLEGTVSNTLDTGLNDAYILMAHSVVSIGHLNAGETRTINLSVQQAPLRPGDVLADQIAADNGLPAAYYPYTNSQQTPNDTQRHIALLSALSGAGYSFIPCNGPCATQAILDKRTIVTSTASVPHLFLPTGSDPLLLQNAPATLIGWADAPLDGINDVTVNGVHTQGQHDSFVQVPLNLDVTNSLNVPPDFLTGQVVATQGNDAALVAPNIYSLPTGSITFGFTLPHTLQLTRGLSITIPNSTTGTLNTSTYNVQARLYNWHTQSWDTIALSQDVLHTSDTSYVGANGQVLLQVMPATTGELYVSKPYVTV